MRCVINYDRLLSDLEKITIFRARHLKVTADKLLVRFKENKMSTPFMSELAPGYWIKVYVASSSGGSFLPATCTVLYVLFYSKNAIKEEKQLNEQPVQIEGKRIAP